MKAVLKPYDPVRHSDRLYQYMTDEESQALFTASRTFPAKWMFDKWMQENMERGEFHDFFMIHDGSGQDEAIGFTYSHNFRENDRHCEFTLCLYEEYRHSGLGFLAAAEMVSYLFNKYSLNQIFTSVYGHNSHSLNIHRKLGLPEVACLPGYRYHCGGYSSLHKFVLDRHRWKEISASVFTKYNHGQGGK